MAKPLSDEQKQAIQRIFDSYAKKVLRGTSINYDKKRSYLTKHETSMSDLPENIYSILRTDNLFQQNNFFEVSTGEMILVKDEDIAHMITLLPIVQREIILLFYFTNMTDTEISKKLNMVRRTVQYQRKAALKILKEILEEKT